MKCTCCGDTTNLIIASGRKGLKTVRRYKNAAFCWSCWYFEVANAHLYDRKNKDGIGDTLIYHQFDRLYERAAKRIQDDAIIEPVSMDDLMSIILGQGAVCALSGHKDRLTFDHILPLGDGGNHTYENLRAVTEYVNNIENAIYFGHLDPNDPRVFYRR